MRKTLYIHIGHFKTGTTALQVFMSQNTRALAKQNVRYAHSHLNMSKHSALAFSLYKAAGVERLMHGYKNPALPQAFWELLFDEVRASAQDKVVISSEEFMRLAQFPKAVEAFKACLAQAGDIEVRVLAYLRRPDRHLRSWFNQLIKMGVKTPAFNQAVTEFIEPVHYDYGLALQPWRELFGAEAVSLRPYVARAEDETAIFADFLTALGADITQGTFKLPKKDPNPRMDERLAELTRLMQEAQISPDVIKWTRVRGEKFLEETASPPADFGAVRQRILDGLNALESLPHLGLDLEAMRKNLPQEARGQEGWELAGLLLNEINFLRNQMHKKTGALEARLAVLEQHLGEEIPSA